MQAQLWFGDYHIATIEVTESGNDVTAISAIHPERNVSQPNMGLEHSQFAVWPRLHNINIIQVYNLDGCVFIEGNDEDPEANLFQGVIHRGGINMISDIYEDEHDRFRLVVA